MSQDMRNDLVRRGDVMDELVKEYNRRWQEGGLKLAWIEKAVDSARPVTDVRENVRGSWDPCRIVRRDTGEVRDALECSVCGDRIFNYYDSEEVDATPPLYCPICGARMERSDE